MNGSRRINKIHLAVETFEACKASHVESVPVREMFRDQVVWEGVVEVFALSGHPKAKRCYAWGYTDAKGMQFVVILELPPVTSARTAVQAYIASLGK